jgi:hypothetical protein
MAADLPGPGHANPTAMAKVLVTYMDDPSKIRRAIKSEFMSAPAERTIRHLREQYLASLEPGPREVFSLHDGYYPQNAAEVALERNRAFISALMREHPERFPVEKLVNAAWDKALTC